MSRLQDAVQCLHNSPVAVERRHIDRGVIADAHNCPIALAINERLEQRVGHGRHAWVSREIGVLLVGGVGKGAAAVHRFRPTQKFADWIRAHDTGDEAERTKRVQPVKLRFVGSPSGPDQVEIAEN